VLGAARTARKRMLPTILAANQAITAIASRDPAKVAEFQKEFGIAGGYSWADAQQMLESDSVDAVYIALPNSMHAEWTVRALAAGKNVLCEKPMALSAAEADRIAAASPGRVVMENFSYRVRQPLAQIASIEVHFSFQATEDHRLRYSRELGGGCFLDLGCYGVDFVHRLLDRQMEISSVEATINESVDESCIVQGRAAGLEILITSSFAQPPRQEFLLRFADGSQQRIERTDDTIALLQKFAAMSHTDPADAVRWQRNSTVYQEVLARMQY